MAEFVDVPVAQVPTESLSGLLEEFASRDGTDYGERETPLDVRVSQLRRQLAAGELKLLFNIADESWDILTVDAATALLAESDEFD